jgi:hypothetical protein
LRYINKKKMGIIIFFMLYRKVLIDNLSLGPFQICTWVSNFINEGP